MLNDSLTDQPIDPLPAQLVARSTRRQMPLVAIPLLMGCLLAGVYFRFVGLDWDEEQHLHPDERFLTMVSSAMQLPSSLAQYFDSKTSPLNPYNNNFGLFVYGDLPIFIVRYTAAALDVLCPKQALPPDAPQLANAPPQPCIGNDNSLYFNNDYGHVYLLGRSLSAIFDLGTLIWLFLIARRLYDWRIALLATALGAASVMQIQQAHFYTTDSFATFFVIAAFYFILRLSETHSWFDTIAAGLGVGLAIASRINVAPLLGILGLALLFPILRGGKQWRARFAINAQTAFVRLIAACIVAVIAFRVFQPYAFDGLFSLDTRFKDNMNYISQAMSGDVSSNPDVQWTDRAPIVFPWVNMVVWGLGVPLGLAAWVGWAFAAFEMLKGRRWLTHLLPWVWIAGYFVWQGSQWVKSMRYLLPIYPFLILFAAVGLIALWDRFRPRTIDGRRRSVVRGLASLALIGLVIVGTYAWAYAFTRIYTQPTTRVAASRWIYDNIPTAATLTVQQDGQPRSIQLPFPNTLAIPSGSPPISVQFKADRDSVVDSITLNRLIALAANPDQETIRLVISETPDASTPLDQSEVTANVEQAGARGGAYVFKFKPIPLKAQQTYYVLVQELSGGPLQAEGSTLGNETWDDPIPLRIDGKDGFSQYHGVDMANYDEDEPDNPNQPGKLTKLIGWLSQTDYVMLTSNRLYASIPRQPLRYPLTSEYYRLLFSGQLGFKLVAVFESYPTLGPFTFPDQETTQAMGLWPDPTRCPQANVPQCQGLIDVPLPPAEEAFSVYDHPRVLIFQKTPEFSVQAALAKLGSVPLRYALNGITPKAETAAPNGLMLKDSVWQAQQNDGTWSDLFDRNGLLNQAPLLGAIVWYLIVALLGVAAFPIMFAIAPGLRDRGYGVSRVLGLLLVAFMIWLLASLRIVAFTRVTIALTVLALIVVGGLLAYRQRAALRTFWQESRRIILIEEILFVVAFAVFLFIRFGNPDLWHPAMGGEKPMDFAYLNAVIKSDYFPPYDPWFAGGQITYYYFGFVLIATLIKLTGILPSIAYNFAIPMLFAMTALGAFCAAFNLSGQWSGVRGQRLIKADRKLALRNPVIVGIIAAIFVTFMGNLGEAQFLTEQISTQVTGSDGINSSLPGVKLIADTAIGLEKMIAEGKQLGFRPEWWYFTPTRLIPAPPTEAGPITEFPFFTFLYADLHAHMIALPLTLLALALAISWLKKIPWWTSGGIGSLVVGGLVVGALRGTNTADYPTYLVICGVALFMGTLAAEPAGSLSTWIRLAIRAGVFLGVSVVSFNSLLTQTGAYSSLEIWKGSVTPLWAWLNVHLLFLFPIVTFMLLEFRRWGWRWWRRMWKYVLAEWRILLIFLAVAAVGISALLYRVNPEGPIQVDVLYDRQVFFAVVPLAVLILLLIVRPRLPVAQRFWLFFVLLAVGLTLVVEVVVVKGDISRMNTVFKYYIQVWVLLGIGSAVAIGWLGDRIRTWPGLGGKLWRGCLYALLGLSFLYVPLAARAKMLDRFVPDMPPGLNGIDYMTQAEYSENSKPAFPLKWDHDLIVWMQDSIKGTPVVAEGQSGLYQWGARISINTGLPTIIGWDWHQRQQRSIMPGQVIDTRLSDVRALYDSSDIAGAKRILDHYGVRYIVVGGLEQAFYSPEGLAKFDQMVADGSLRVAYQNEGAKLYEVIR